MMAPTHRNSQSRPRSWRLVVPRGELDIATAGRLHSTIQRELRISPQWQVVIDLRQVTFLDCSTLSVMLRAHHSAAARGGWVRLVHNQPMVSTILRATRTASVFPRYTSVDHAVTAPPGQPGTRPPDRTQSAQQPLQPQQPRRPGCTPGARSTASAPNPPPAPNSAAAPSG